MSKLLWTAKPVSEWTSYDQLAFNIRVVDADRQTFFNTTQLHPAHVSNKILDNLIRLANEHLQKDIRLFFRYLGFVEKPLCANSTSHVNDFVAFVLRFLDYDDRDRVICQRLALSFSVAGQRVDAEDDLCVREENDYLLLVQEEKRRGSLDNPDPQLVTHAIAAFYQSNLHRRDSGQPQLTSKHIPVVAMVNSAPIFYRVPVTMGLVHALVTATYPEEETVVLRYFPPVPNRMTYRDVGMRPLDNRRVVLRCFEALKALL